MSEPTATPYLTANFGEEGGIYSWASYDEVNAWVSKYFYPWA